CEDESSDGADPSRVPWWEEERASLQRSLRALQTQFAGERARREALEREAQLLSGENVALEQQVSGMEACRVCRVENGGQSGNDSWKDVKNLCRLHLCWCFRPHLHPEEDGPGPAARSPAALKRWDSERLLGAAHTPPDSPGRILQHQCTCARRAEATKYRGISLLHEVDAQYSALQAKYEELLQRCQREEEEEEGKEGEEEEDDDGSSQKSSGVEEDQQPEYKRIFKQIFSHIQKSKEEL
ncbi:unnamed protein product, partial [Tetraodon nigroviridis]